MKTNLNEPENTLKDAQSPKIPDFLTLFPEHEELYRIAETKWNRPFDPEPIGWLQANIGKLNWGMHEGLAFNPWYKGVEEALKSGPIEERVTFVGYTLKEPSENKTDILSHVPIYQLNFSKETVPLLALISKQRVLCPAVWGTGHIRQYPWGDTGYQDLIEELLVVRIYRGKYGLKALSQTPHNFQDTDHFVNINQPFNDLVMRIRNATNQEIFWSFFGRGDDYLDNPELILTIAITQLLEARARTEKWMQKINVFKN